MGVRQSVSLASQKGNKESESGQPGNLFRRRGHAGVSVVGGVQDPLPYEVMSCPISRDPPETPDPAANLHHGGPGVDQILLRTWPQRSGNPLRGPDIAKETSSSSGRRRDRSRRTFPRPDPSTWADPGRQASKLRYRRDAKDVRADGPNVEPGKMARAVSAYDTQDPESSLQRAILCPRNSAA